MILFYYESLDNTLSCFVLYFVLWKDLLDNLRWVKYQVLYNFIVFFWNAQVRKTYVSARCLRYSCKMHRISSQRAVHIVIRSVASRWNENAQVLVWNLLVLQLTPERHQCLTDVLTSADMVYCNMLVLFQSLSYVILGETLWNLIWCFGSSILKGFAVPLCILTWEEKSSPAKSAGEKYLQMKQS